MQWRDLLADWGLNKLKLSAGFLDLEFSPSDEERRAAWDMVVELSTRVATQPLDDREGTDEAALASLHALFGITRGILKQYGPRTQDFARVAIAVLNEVLRPFLSRWHPRLGPTGLPAAERATFRAELREVQAQLVERYLPALQRIAEVKL